MVSLSYSQDIKAISQDHYFYIIIISNELYIFLNKYLKVSKYSIINYENLIYY